MKRVIKGGSKAARIYRAGKRPQWASLDQSHLGLVPEESSQRFEEALSEATSFHSQTAGQQLESDSSKDWRESVVTQPQPNDNVDSSNLQSADPKTVGIAEMRETEEMQSEESSSEFEFDDTTLSVPTPQMQVDATAATVQLPSAVTDADTGSSERVSEASILALASDSKDKIKSVESDSTLGFDSEMVNAANGECVSRSQDTDSESETDSSSDSADESDTSESSDGLPKHREFVHLRKEERVLVDQMLRQKRANGSIEASSTVPLSMDEEMEAMECLKKARESELREESRSQLIRVLKARELAQLKQLANAGCGLSDVEAADIPSDSDGSSVVDEETGELRDSGSAFDLWKVREMKRLLRDFEEDLRCAQLESGGTPFASDAEADDERVEDASTARTKRLRTDRFEKTTTEEIPRKKRKFLQKYFHKGVFFDDDSVVESEIRQRDFAAASTGKDAWMDYENAPEPMKRKRFGLMSQTKWTHLANEDTTDKRDDFQFGVGSGAAEPRRKGRAAHQRHTRPYSKTSK